MATLYHKSIYFTGLSRLSAFYVPVVLVLGRSTRACDSCNMKVTKLRAKLGQRAIRFRGPKFWNSLPKELRVISKYVKFKKKSLKELCFFLRTTRLNSVNNNYVICVMLCDN